MRKTARKAPSEFIARIRAKMAADNLTITSLARVLDLSHPTVTEIVTYEYQPSFETCLALSAWLGELPEQTLRSAGLLRSEPVEDEYGAQANQIISSYMSPETKKQGIQLLKLLQISEKTGEYRILGPLEKRGNEKKDRENKESLKKALGV